MITLIGSALAIISTVLGICWWKYQQKQNPKDKYQSQLNENANVIANADKHPDDLNGLLDDRLNRVRPSTNQSDSSGQAGNPAER
jgi:type II secretory pathway component PulL